MSFSLPPLYASGHPRAWPLETGRDVLSEEEATAADLWQAMEGLVHGIAPRNKAATYELTHALCEKACAQALEEESSTEGSAKAIGERQGPRRLRHALKHLCSVVSDALEDDLAADLVLDLVKANPHLSAIAPTLQGSDKLALHEGLLIKWLEQIDPNAMDTAQNHGEMWNLLQTGSFVMLGRLLQGPSCTTQETAREKPFFQFASCLAHCWPRKTLPQALWQVQARGFDLGQPGWENMSALEQANERGMGRKVQEYFSQQALGTLEQSVPEPACAGKLRL